MLGVVGMMVFQQVGRFIESVIEFHICRVPTGTGKISMKKIEHKFI